MARGPSWSVQVEWPEGGVGVEWREAWHGLLLEYTHRGLRLEGVGIRHRRRHQLAAPEEATGGGVGVPMQRGGEGDPTEAWR